MLVGKSNGHRIVYEFVSGRDTRSGMNVIAATPMLWKDERIVATFPQTWLRLTGLEADLLDHGIGGYPTVDGEVALFNPGKRPGTLFVTNMRLVFLRRSEDWPKKYHAYKNRTFEQTLDRVFLSGHDLVALLEELRYDQAGRWNSRPSKEHILDYAGIEFCEILLDEISGLERSRFGGYAFIDAKQRKYRLRLDREPFTAVEGQLKNAKGSDESRSA